MNRILLLLLAFALAACSSEPESNSPNADLAALESYKLEIREKLPDVGRIDVDELARRLAEDPAPVLLDVRASEEFAVSHLRGARHAEELEDALQVLAGKPKSSEIVVYCSIGYRSGYLAKELQEQGFENVRNLEGSIFEWVNEGHAVYRGDEVVREVHPYDTTWGKLLDRNLWSEIE